ncbi:MAG: alkaline phosphatase PhoX [Planctomycetota bacterium]
MSLNRRNFLTAATATGLAFTSLGRAAGGAYAPGAPRPRATDGLGPLVPDPEGFFDLPAGFEYRVLSRVGEEMDDGLLVPPRHDGMAAFAGEDGRTVLVRNHENPPGQGGAFGESNDRLERVPADKLYDVGVEGTACLGGTTTLVYNTETQELEKHWLSLAGTIVNCAGGPTPWGSWISCEEVVLSAEGPLQREHGYCFEVPAGPEGLVDPVPLVGLGRFRHEAIAVDPLSGCVFLTEDVHDGLFYRFVPSQPGDLAAGGKLQALRVREAPSLDTRNWHRLTQVPPGEELTVDWVDLDDVEAPLDDLRHRGFLAGAARFTRGEGVWFGGGSIWFTCTSGGESKLGQIWRYTPSKYEGDRKERMHRGTLALFLEPNDGGVLENCDNLCVAPWGHLVVCEDGGDDDYLRGVTLDGEVYQLARNAADFGELAGCVFSPDGSTLFVNSQKQGVTLAVTGPWEKARDL